MPDGVQISVDDRGARALLDALARNAGNLQPAMADIGQMISDDARLAFTDGRDPWGNAWQALSAVTLALRRGKGRGGAQPLLDTGRLRNSIGFVAGGASVNIRANAVYAAFQQFGARRGQSGSGRQRTRNRIFPIPWGDVPARPFLPIRNGAVDLPAAQRAQIDEILLAHLGLAA